MKFNQPCSTITVQLIDYIQQNPQTIYHMDQFLERYQNPILNFVKLTIGNYEDSMVLTNKILFTLSKKVKEIEKKETFNFLALLVIKGEIQNYRRSLQRQKEKAFEHHTIVHNNQEISLLETLEVNPKKAEEIFNLLVIRDIIENAPDPLLKDIFYLKYREGESIDDIALKLGQTTYQIKKYLKTLHEQVKKHLEDR